MFEVGVGEKMVMLEFSIIFFFSKIAEPCNREEKLMLNGCIN